ncbi:MAG: polyphosphate polymerase domain-containing protein [Steroidobacteraceae bacterium]
MRCIPMSTLGPQRDSRDFAFELKFYISGTQADVLTDWARARLDPDPHGGGPHGDSYRVSSLYFDTAAFDVLARHRSYGRSKYRIRRYNQGDAVYLERKTRGQSRVYKRRSRSSMENLPRLLAAQSSSDWGGHWFYRRLRVRALEPVSRIDYQRIARIGYSDYGPVRLTLDQELCAWRARTVSFDTSGGGAALSRAQQILELKFGHTMPAVFKELIREFGPRLNSISKYRLACAALGLFPCALEPTRLAQPGALRELSEKLDA